MIPKKPGNITFLKKFVHLTHNFPIYSRGVCNAYAHASPHRVHPAAHAKRYESVPT